MRLLVTQFLKDSMKIFGCRLPMLLFQRKPTERHSKPMTHGPRITIGQLFKVWLQYHQGLGSADSTTYCSDRSILYRWEAHLLNKTGSIDSSHLWACLIRFCPSWPPDITDLTFLISYETLCQPLTSALLQQFKSRVMAGTRSCFQLVVKLY
jgi:hypothetical protein